MNTSTSAPTSDQIRNSLSLMGSKGLTAIAGHLIQSLVGIETSFALEQAELIDDLDSEYRKGMFDAIIRLAEKHEAIRPENAYVETLSAALGKGFEVSFLSNYQTNENPVKPQEIAQTLSDEATLALLKLVRQTIEFPFAQVCKHFVAGNMLDTMERLGFPLTHELVKHVLKAHDEESLTILDQLIEEKTLEIQPIRP